MNSAEVPPAVMHVSIYPAQGATHSSAADFSALAGYTKSLFANFPPEVRRKHVVVTNTKGDGFRSFFDDGLEVREAWDKGSCWYAWQIFRQAYVLTRYRIVHLQHEFNQFGGSLTLPLNILLLVGLRWILRKKIVVTWHEVVPLAQIDRAFLDRACIRYPVWFTRLIVRTYYFVMLRLAHVAVVQDEYFAQVLRADYRARGRVVVVRMGAEPLTPAAPEISRQRWGLRAAARVAVFFGTIDWRKGLDLLVDAWALMLPEACTLLIAGGKPMRVEHTADYQQWFTQLEERIRKTQNIQFIGFIDDSELPLLFGAADLVLLPYLVPQKVSAVFNQAASYGRPVLTTDVFAADVDPVLVFEAQPAALAAKVSWALERGLPQLQELARAHRDSCSWAGSAAALVSVYESLGV